jgi:hypothetical protein
MWRLLEDRRCWDDTRPGWAATSPPVPEAWLRPTDHLLASFTGSSEDHLPITVHPGECAVAVCPESGARYDIPHESRVIYEFDQAAAVGALAAALETTGPCEALRPDLWRLGSWSPIAGEFFPVFLSLPSEQEVFRSHLGLASASADRPFLLFTGTDRWYTSEVIGLVRGRRGGIAPIGRAITVQPDGTCSPTVGLAAIFKEFLREHAPAALNTKPQRRFPTPAGATWGDVRIRFVDGHTVHVDVKGVDHRMSYQDMGLEDKRKRAPNKQFLLLLAFANARGELTWKSKAASPDNQKRRERLAKALQSFFGISGDPFEFDDDLKGWRARFRIEPEH